MRKNFGPHEWGYPMPVYMIGTYNEDGSANVMNAAWGGISNTAEISFCISHSHKTAENVVKAGAFTVSIATEDYISPCDYVGIVSGNKDKDKLSKAGFTAIKSEYVNAPIIKELPLALECEVISYDYDTERLVGRIVNVSIAEEILTDNDKVDVRAMKPIIFDPVNLKYWSFGEIVGSAYRDGKSLIK